MQHTLRLNIDCPDQIGLVAAVAQFLAAHQANIIEANHHTDLNTGHFFMRHEICADSLTLKVNDFSQAFSQLAEQYQMNWRVTDSQQRKKVVLLASHESHCLVDVLHRWHSGELECEISAVIANHQTM